MPCNLIKLVDVEEMNYLASKGEGEVSEACRRSPPLSLSPASYDRCECPFPAMSCKAFEPLSRVVLVILKSNWLLFESP